MDGDKRTWPERVNF